MPGVFTKTEKAQKHLRYELLNKAQKNVLRDSQKMIISENMSRDHIMSINDLSEIKQSMKEVPPIFASTGENNVFK